MSYQGNNWGKGGKNYKKKAPICHHFNSARGCRAGNMCAYRHVLKPVHHGGAIVPRTPPRAPPRVPHHGFVTKAFSGMAIGGGKGGPQKMVTKSKRVKERITVNARGQAVKVKETVIVKQEVVAYNACAGQTRIKGTHARDKFGNAKGGRFDLARDGAFTGKKVAVVQLYTGEGFDFSLPLAALKEKGFEVLRWTAWPAADELKRALEGCCQCWVISGCTQTVTKAHVDVLRDFFKQGRGLYIWGDNDPYYADANVLTQALFGAKMSGNEMGCKCVTEKKAGAPGAGFVPHLITTGIEKLYEGETIATVEPNQPPKRLTPLVCGSAGNVVTAVWDGMGQRCVVDGGFTRLWCGWDTAGSARFVKNVAAWLANAERFGAKVRCFKCGKVGHYADKCHVKKAPKGKGRKGGGGRSVVCFKCGKAGHKADVCRSKRR